MGLLVLTPPKGYFYFWIILVLILGIFTLPSQTSIHIKDYGVRPVKTGDTAMVFYANVDNIGPKNDDPIATRLKMEKCCLTDSNDKSLCNAMKLISGLGALLQSKDTFTLQMYFVNFDLSNREGTCILRLLTRLLSAASQEQQWEHGQELSIPFKTGSTGPGILQQILESTGWAQGTHKLCSMNNENVAQDCANQECQIRFAGTRSFHNKTSNLCESIPECGATDSKTMLSPITGTCEKLHDISHIRLSFSTEMVTVKDIPVSVIIKAKPKEQISPKAATEHTKKIPTHAEVLINEKSPKPHLVCEHGNHVKGKDGLPNCTCHQSWRSLTAEEWEMKGGLVSSKDGIPLYKMCTVPIMDPHKRAILLLVFLILAIMTPIAALLICMYRKRKDEAEKVLSKIFSSATSTGGKEKTSSPEEGEQDKLDNDKDEDAFISQIIGRREHTPTRQPTETRMTHPTSKASIQNEVRSTSTALQSSTSTSTKHKSNYTISAGSGSAATFRTTPNKPENFTLPPDPAFKLRATFDSSRNSTSRESIPSPSWSDLVVRASRTLSTDEFFRDKHVPINPAPSDPNSNVKKESVVPPLLLVAEESKNGNQNYRYAPTEFEESIAGAAPVSVLASKSISEKEITEHKKHVWDHYFESRESIRSDNTNEFTVYSVTVDNTPATSSPFNEIRSKHSSVDNLSLDLDDFDNFHRNAKPSILSTEDRYVGAEIGGLTHLAKTESLPIMKTNFENITDSETRIEPEKELYEEKTYELISEVKNPFMDGNNEHSPSSSISEANNNSISLSRSSHSIWLNVASENATEPEPSDLLSSAAAPSVASRTSSYDDLRMKRIYGSLESDEDSEAALEEIASSSTKATCRSVSNQQTIAKRFEENQKLFGFPQKSSSPSISSISMHSRRNDDESSRFHERDTNNNVFQLESDSVPSDAYKTDSSVISFASASHSPTVTSFWNQSNNEKKQFSERSRSIYTSSSSNASMKDAEDKCGDHDLDDYANSNTIKRIRSQSNTDLLSGETRSAGKVESSLQNSLKATRSKSDSSFLPIE